MDFQHQTWRFSQQLWWLSQPKTQFSVKLNGGCRALEITKSMIFFGHGGFHKFEYPSHHPFIDGSSLNHPASLGYYHTMDIILWGWFFWWKIPLKWTIKSSNWDIPMFHDWTRKQPPCVATRRPASRTPGSMSRATWSSSGAHVMGDLSWGLNHGWSQPNCYLMLLEWITWWGSNEDTIKSH